MVAIFSNQRKRKANTLCAKIQNTGGGLWFVEQWNTRFILVSEASIKKKNLCNFFHILKKEHYD